MATIDSLFDSGRGRLGNLVFYKMKGRNIVRTKPEHFSDRKSPAQLAQRQRMQAVNNFLQPFSNLLSMTFDPESERLTARQAAQSYNMRNAVAGEYPDIYIDKGRALLSRGPLPVPVKAWMEIVPEGLLIQWENGEEAAGSAANDTLLVMASFPGQSSCMYQFSEARRTAGQYLWKLQVPVKEDALPDVWISFRNDLRSLMSNSMFVPGE
jgi:hypothetical protein